MKTRAFTLIELLVVVAIIALLIAILLPSLGRAKATATRVKCAAVLKQWGTAINIYANEYDGWFQSASDWATRSGGNGIYDAEWPTDSKFSRGLHTCPGDPVFGQYLQSGSTASTATYGPIDYCMVRYVDGNSNRTASGSMFGTAWRMTDINHPNTALLMCDSASYAGGGSSGTAIVSYMGVYPTTPGDLDNNNTTVSSHEFFKDTLQKRHLGLGNVMFLDAHVEQHSFSDFQQNIVPGSAQPLNGKYWTARSVQ